MISVAIDGPAGAGKSTIARELAKRFSLIHVDTGAIYRAAGLYFLRRGENPADKSLVLPELCNITVELSFVGEEQHMRLCGEDVTDAIRTPEASMAASAISAIPEVRTFLLEQQRSIARENDVVMDGRDIGTVVLPDATVKIFLTADPEARARRRYKELLERGIAAEYEQVLSDVQKRDTNDSSRAAAPLRQAQDAILVDTSHLDFAGSVKLLSNIITEKLAQCGAEG
ncbi:MAG: (d)CMP kinase [Angelakisella sp.]